MGGGYGFRRTRRVPFKGELEGRTGKGRMGLGEGTKEIRDLVEAQISGQVNRCFATRVAGEGVSMVTQQQSHNAWVQRSSGRRGHTNKGTTKGT